jgi:hypothetical protein
VDVEDGSFATDRLEGVADVCHRDVIGLVPYSGPVSDGLWFR